MNFPRIVIDARMIGPHGHGIANYLCDILAGLRKLQEEKPLPYELYFLVRPNLPETHFLRHYPFETVHAPFLHPKELFILPKILKKLGATLYFSPSFSSLASYPCPHVQTIHDLNHLQFGGLFHKLYYQFLVRPSARNAAALFTVSESAKKEIQAWLGKEKKLEITWNAIQEPMALSAYEEKRILEKFGLSKEQYFFCLANPKAHKNIAFLERAYQRYAANTKNALPLCSLQDLSAQEIAALLRNTKAFFFPSLYEGFGRPPLEAAVCERVVVAAKIPVVEEALAPIPEKEKLLLDPREEALWISAFQQAQAGELTPVSAATKEILLRSYAVKPLAQVVDAAFQRCHS